MPNSISWKAFGLAALLAMAVSFAAGRYSAPTHTLTETRTQTDVQKDAAKQVNTDKDQHVETVKTEIKKPDGTVITTTTTKQDTDTKQVVNQDTKTNTEKSSDSKTEVTRTSSPITINALAGADVTNLAGGLVYGLSVSRPMLGPITAGVWGMTNKTGGVSLGLQF